MSHSLSLLASATSTIISDHYRPSSFGLRCTISSRIKRREQGKPHLTDWLDTV